MTLYYQNNGITIYHGDALEVLPTLADTQRFNHILTDPPYSNRTHKGTRTNRNGCRGKRLVNFDSMTCEEICQVFELCSENLTGWLLSFMDWQHVAEIAKSPPKQLRFVRFGIWNKTNGAPQISGDRPGMGWEAIAILHREGRRMKWNGGGQRAVWTSPRSKSQFHVAQKPLSLVKKLVALFCEPDALIVDPFMGSGTTLRAAMDTGCRAIGIEREERYCEVAASRLAQRTMVW